MDVPEVIAVVRDVLLIFLLLVATVTLLVVLRKVSGLLSSARRTMKNLEEVVDAVSSRIVGPASGGSGVAFGAGKLAAFFLGFSRNRKSKEGGENDG